jgi:hypothetical protein
MASKAIDDKAKEEALKKLIRDTVNAAGAVSPGDIPHQVKERLKGHATGDLDVDAVIREALAKKRGR